MANFKYEIIKADLTAHKKEIIGIINRNLGEHSNDWYVWKYEGCPFAKVQCWLAKEKDKDDFVGSVALFPRKMVMDGKEILAAVAGDIAVDKKHRVFGPAMRLKKSALANICKSNIVCS